MSEKEYPGLFVGDYDSFEDFTLAKFGSLQNAFEYTNSSPEMGVIHETIDEFLDVLEELCEMHNHIHSKDRK